MLRQLWQFRAIQWSLGGGLLASLCCVGPPLAVMLGLSGASFLAGMTLLSPYFYGASFLLLLAGYVYTQRRQSGACSLGEQRRNRWLFPLVMAGMMSGSYLLLTEGLTPLLTPAASARLAPDAQQMLAMPGMDHGAMSSADMVRTASASPADRPVMAAAAVPMVMAGTIHRAELAVDKMT
ncbi:MAG: hypothetical protein HYY02_13675 [Chloroflexi bacterium]|nr:hypothetical protein [Chloroflexota bacterium]